MPLRTTLAPAFLILPLAGWDGPPAGPIRPFGLGPVDLLALAAGTPSLELPERVETPPGTVTSRELRATAQSFLEKEIWKPLDRVRLKSGGASPKADLPYVSTSSFSSGAEAALAVLIPTIAVAIGWATSQAARDAATCRDFLSARGAAISSFLREIPDTDTPASQAALERWARLSRGVLSYPACVGIRAP